MVIHRKKLIELEELVIPPEERENYQIVVLGETIYLVSFDEIAKVINSEQDHLQEAYRADSRYFTRGLVYDYSIFRAIKEDVPVAPVKSRKKLREITQELFPRSNFGSMPDEPLTIANLKQSGLTVYDYDIYYYLKDN